jgi:predicted dehydrogenase
MSLSRRQFMGSQAALAATITQSMSAQTSANDRVQVACIGCGARAHELMAAAMAHPQFEITTLVDAYTGRLQRAQDRIKDTRGTAAKVAKDYRAVLADKSIDAVIIATPDHWHKQMVVEAMQAGKDVYCEKPLTYKSAEGLEIIATAKQTGRMLQVGSQGVSSMTEVRARQMIQEGKLGKVTMIRAAYNRNTASGAWIYPIPPDANPQTVNWDMFLGGATKRPFDLARFFRWRCYQEYSGGIATDLFVHLCTTIHFLMAAKMPSRVTAMGELYRWKESRDVPDTLNAILEYPEGFTVNLSSTFNNQSSSEASFTFLGTEGTLSVGWGELKYWPESVKEDNRWIVESWPKALQAKYYEDPKVIREEVPGLSKAHMVDAGTAWREEGQDASIIHFWHFLNSIRTRKPYWEDAVAGHHAAACAHMVNQSARTGRLVQWDYAKDDIQA